MFVFNSALDFGKDMIELSASTLGRLAGIQLTDMTKFLEHQSVAIYRLGDAHGIAALLTLQREYRDAFWKDRGAALAATREVIRLASRRAAKSWTELMAKSDTAPAVPALNPPERTNSRSADPGSKIRASQRKPTRTASAKSAVGVATVPSARRKAKVTPTRSGETPPDAIAAAPSNNDQRVEQSAAGAVTRQRRSKIRKVSGENPPARD